jgi:hypothetical protein
MTFISVEAPHQHTNTTFPNTLRSLSKTVYTDKGHGEHILQMVSSKTKRTWRERREKWGKMKPIAAGQPLVQDKTITTTTAKSTLEIPLGEYQVIAE